MADNYRVDPQDFVELDLTDEELHELNNLVLQEDEFFLMLDVLTDYFNQIASESENE